MLDAPGEFHIFDHRFECRATDMLHGFPKGVTYEEVLEVLEDRFGDHQLAAANRSQLKTRTQGVGESLQQFARIIEQFGNCAYLTLLEDHIRREAGETFSDSVEDSAIKMPLLGEKRKTTNEALRVDIEL
jgi:hypothetical protein